MVHSIHAHLSLTRDGMFLTASGLWRRCFRCCAVRAAAVRAVHPDDMLSHSRCLTRSLGRSITALRQVRVSFTRMCPAE